MSVFRPACVFMRKKTHYSKPVESGSGRLQFCIVIRELSNPIFDHGIDSAASCPCLTCSIKITQVGISEVVYSRRYGMDESVGPPRKSLSCIAEHHETAAVFEKGGVKFRQFSPVSFFWLLIAYLYCIAVA